MLVLAGPSASGKSTLALALAEQGNAEIVNADSLQLYRSLRVLTARPPPSALARAPHRLYGVLSASERASAGDYKERAARAIEAILRRGALPILCGGSGLYLRALLQGLAPNPAAVAHGALEAARARVQAWRAEKADLYALLQQCDPQTARSLAPKDSHRITRALEFFEAYGEPWGAQRNRPTAPPAFLATAPRLVVALLPPRALLYAAIDARFERMLEEGAIEEVRLLQHQHLRPDNPIGKAIGLAEISRFLAGEIDRAQLLRLASRRIRNYAKRQITWLRHQLPCDLVLEGPLCQAMQPLCATIAKALADKGVIDGLDKPPRRV